METSSLIGYNLDEREVASLTDEILNYFQEQVCEKELYIIVGAAVSNIYSLEYLGKEVTVVCLESIQDDLEKIRFLLSHEIHHWVRQTLVKDNIFNTCIGERMVTEGLAAHFTAELYPGYSPAEYCYLPPETVGWVSEHFNELEAIIMQDLTTNKLENLLFARNFDLAEFFSEQARFGEGIINRKNDLIRKMPLRTGYIFAFILVDNYLKATGQTAVGNVATVWEKILSQHSS